MPHCWPMGRRAQARVTRWWATGPTKAWFLNSASDCFRPSEKTRRADSVRWRAWLHCPVSCAGVKPLNVFALHVFMQVFFSMLEIYNEQVTEEKSSWYLVSFYFFSVFHLVHFRLPPLCPGGWPAVSGVSHSGGAQSQRGAAERLLCGGPPNSPVWKRTTGKETEDKYACTCRNSVWETVTGRHTSLHWYKINLPKITKILFSNAWVFCFFFFLSIIELLYKFWFNILDFCNVFFFPHPFP